MNIRSLLAGISFTVLILGTGSAASAQSYSDSVSAYRKDYVSKHEVVGDSLKSGFDFYAADPAYRIVADVEEVRDSPWFSVATSGKLRKTFRVYAIARFTVDGKPQELSLLQSQALGAGYEDYLFLPFTDASNGEQTYTNGRYMDLTISSIRDKKITLDFNKCYNAYCAYVSGKYNCPIPPQSNRLEIAIPAGEKVFKGGH